MYLLDTNVVSELRKVRTGKANTNVARWADSVKASTLFLSVIVVHELEIGVQLLERRDASQGAILRTWLEKRVLTTFRNRILPVDTTVARTAAGLHVPDPRPVRDALIAATALVHDLTVVTRNVADFAPTGVVRLNPWEFDHLQQ